MSPFLIYSISPIGESVRQEKSKRVAYANKTNFGFADLFRHKPAYYIQPQWSVRHSVVKYKQARQQKNKGAADFIQLLTIEALDMM